VVGATVFEDFIQNEIVKLLSPVIAVFAFATAYLNWLQNLHMLYL
jgi:hypothetical protein